MPRLIAWAVLHRQRIARLVLVAAVCFGATKVWPEVPHSTDMRLDLGPQHREIMEVRIEVSRDGEHLQGASYRFPEGAPSTLRHEVMLPSGRYDIQVRCRRERGTSEVQRVVDLPSQGTLRLDVRGDRA